MTTGSTHSTCIRRWYAQVQSPVVESARRSPIAFLHEHTLDGFRRARDLGVGGIETEAWMTADGVVVCDHDGRIGGKVVRRPIGQLPRTRLPASIPTLDDLCALWGTGAGFELSLDVRAEAAAALVVAVARAADPGAPKRLWLGHADVEVLAGWREEFPDVRLVNRTRVRDVPEGLEKRAAQLAAKAIDAFAVHYTEWTGGHVALFHRFERLAFALDVQHERVIREAARMGVDGLSGDHADRLVAVLGR